MTSKGVNSIDFDSASLLQEREEQIFKYERFIDEKLKVNLQNVLDSRDKLFEKLSHLMELKTKIQMVKDEKLSEMKAMINLGSEVYVQAKVRDTSRIFVDVGLGFHVEYTLDEALQYADVREKHYTQQSEEMTKKAAEIKTQIKWCYEILSKLMDLQAENQ
eukprot:TRINITY_DN4253_c0_g1_i4.p1 TRINITY_DN4253_c0_g1~~TRINITY_DN4253_c0_g1_i4.p1  ORF type:complete len:161 (-),score=47.18 TRINITY_DN4253_c0_g1_i4:165-647(-)